MSHLAGRRTWTRRLVTRMSLVKSQLCVWLCRYNQLSHVFQPYESEETARFVYAGVISQSYSSLQDDFEQTTRFGYEGVISVSHSSLQEEFEQTAMFGYASVISPSHSSLQNEFEQTTRFGYAGV